MFSGLGCHGVIVRSCTGRIPPAAQRHQPPVRQARFSSCTRPGASRRRRRNRTTRSAPLSRWPPSIQQPSISADLARRPQPAILTQRDGQSRVCLPAE
jgi:hypothetical protein